MKHLTKAFIIGLSALTSIVTGAATPQPEAALDAAAVLARDTEVAGGIEKRGSNGANCWKNNAHTSSYWRIQTWGPWDDDWGSGFLDNLRRQCSYLDWPSDWVFGYQQGAPPTDGYATFRLNRDHYDSHCVEDSIWLASNGAGGGGGAINGVVCWESNKWW